MLTGGAIKKCLAGAVVGATMITTSVAENYVWSGLVTIENIDVSNDQFYFRSDPRPVTPACASATFYIADTAHVLFEEKVSALITAFAAGYTLNVNYDEDVLSCNVPVRRFQVFKN